MLIKLCEIAAIANLKIHYPWEKSDKQEVKINVSVEYNESKECKKIEDVLDYVQLEDCILKIVNEKTFEIIEALGHEICDATLKQFPQIFNIAVKITKIGVMKSAKSVSITIKKQKEQGIKVAFSLGSNLGDRDRNLLAGYKKLCEKLELFDTKISNFINTKAVLPNESPKHWDIDFLNCAVSGFTRIQGPIEILRICQGIENDIGGIILEREKNAPRVLDIDLIYFGGKIVSMEDFQVPHKLCYFRNFVLTPFFEIEPNLVISDFNLIK